MAKLGLNTEDAYRIVQLASFNAFYPSPAALNIRQNPPSSLASAESSIASATVESCLRPRLYIKDIIEQAELVACPDLDITQAEVTRWNKVLTDFFYDKKPVEERDGWMNVFSIQNRLHDEDILFQRILGC